ncbi:hypothetical protein HD553DRAFT_362721 [Filobasidium floriforme]|uniref:uncharacterized protein n=1 Tax=Filobasidium floriforme TaxID=5210 RepID=UPI001E8D63DE|nr:uncharacterized protein HD553DRAFT_362721 [Filobasidium floriforme]KAH8080017.1 hypothetical protein HD553DRAFT_362721 [Filobasidium floriforme]
MTDNHSYKYDISVPKTQTAGCILYHADVFIDLPDDAKISYDTCCTGVFRKASGPRLLGDPKVKVKVFIKPFAEGGQFPSDLKHEDIENLVFDEVQKLYHPDSLPREESITSTTESAPPSTAPSAGTTPLSTTWKTAQLVDKHLRVRWWMPVEDRGSSDMLRLQKTFAPRANDYLRVSPSPHPCKQDYRFAMTYEYTYEIREATLGNGHTHRVKFIVDNVEVNESNRVRDHLFTLPRDGPKLYIVPYAEGGSLPPGLNSFQIEKLCFAEVKRQYTRETEETDYALSQGGRTSLSVAVTEASTV